jgi:RNA polymerase sporulation-specific sigma factor
VKPSRTLAVVGEAELVMRLRPLAYSIAREFYLPGGDADDVRQEALVGLLSGIRTWRPDGGMALKSFVALAVRRQLITALKGANRQKHRPLDESRRAVANADGEIIPILDVLEAPGTDAFEQLAARDELRRLGRDLRVSLSAMEARCLILWANGASYRQIEEMTDADSWKAVDRAIQRARWKLAGVGPPSSPRFGSSTHGRRVYECPRCGLETVRVTVRGFERKGAGRPPMCNVCTTRQVAA